MNQTEEKKQSSQKEKEEKTQKILDDIFKGWIQSDEDKKRDFDLLESKAIEAANILNDARILLEELPPIAPTYPGNWTNLASTIRNAKRQLLYLLREEKKELDK